MRTVTREIVGALIWSADKRVLLCRRGNDSGKSYAGMWHAPGGGIEADESLEEAIVREVREECGLELRGEDLKIIDTAGSGESEKDLPDGERVIVQMRFTMFWVELSKIAQEIDVKLSDEFVEARWFLKEELESLALVPAGRELFGRLGLL